MNFVDQFLQDHFEEFTLDRYGLGKNWETLLLTPRFATSRHVVALVFPSRGSEPALVVKVPRQPGDNSGVRREAAMLDQLSAAVDSTGGGVPRLVGIKDAGPFTVLVETALTGTPLDPRTVAADLPSAVATGTEFVAALPCTRAAADNADWYRRAVAAPLAALEGLAGPDAQTCELVERTHQLLGPLSQAQLPAVIEHGDLSHPNLLVKPGGALQVMDWERSLTDGVPGHDLVFYLQYLSESSEQAFDREAQLAAFDKAFGQGGWALDPLSRHLGMRGVDQALLPLLVIATWARSTATLADRLAQEAEADPSQGRGKVRAALQADRDFWLWRHVVEAA
ncbi:aminoglycoside phosphotransferase (APT) family kinase protein [Pseudarthrobacter defluvii]|uniref:aminoglycoside phosphotransferase family protein n=1 Tax=Pseudarthrobacter defluvii TaxID=410837 RepID=UPI0027841DC2|nr:aminoglycoside phosphotransferase family protein [Pseudarthrobacter defluvii]MDQ0771343.1 aminoglycoside phosphotransferase (APT) family kinase protein [Pseudarthrobacter defluvii]